jgi:hypothetical protein
MRDDGDVKHTFAPSRKPRFVMVLILSRNTTEPTIDSHWATIFFKLEGGPTAPLTLRAVLPEPSVMRDIIAIYARTLEAIGEATKQELPSRTYCKTVGLREFRDEHHCK